MGLSSPPAPSPPALFDAVWQRKDEPPAEDITPRHVPLPRTRSSGHRRPVRSTAACSAKGEHAHRRVDRRRRHHFLQGAMGGHRCLCAAQKQEKEGEERKNKARGRRPFTAAHRAAGACVRAGHGGPVATANGAAAPPPRLGLVERTETEKGRDVQGLRAAMAWPWRGGWTGRRCGEGPPVAPPDTRGRNGSEANGLGFSRERQPAPGFDPAKSTESRRIRSDGQDRLRAAGDGAGQKPAQVGRAQAGQAEAL